jgi:RNA polymerase sigma-70 factor (ECF subfamily)
LPLVSAQPARWTCPQQPAIEPWREIFPLGYTVHSVTERAGDTGSFEELAMPHFARLFNFACWLTADKTSAEDLVQETYMKALRGFSGFQQGTNFRAIDDDEMPFEPSTDVTPEAILIAQVEQETIQRVLEQLPVNSREVILLCDLEEMSYQEISQTIGVPIGTVMSRIARARKSMRTLLGSRKVATQ